ncbi:flagellar hook-length control protein FliK [Campylobacter lari]|uniref:flagellar hook-length control protein FliK n=1 Tax=Campylobacter sp. CNRCH_2014_2452 TaxID=2911603 RepID=UPI00128328D3|nr:flagellar hook-length control protein FliK [Campylobacter sp. CNRCH_2014_2452]EAK0818308.1 flagellar hook-length control protein FliK [Campylobacter lari]EAK9891026.1 flagellar hook-length control protein FliK [Campylobacter lari]EGK8025448.1 flagellar hook-length control protein FliK [Campylobacter lari]EGK8128818.1 flagellar hook-length control protein FliK [Campylobacter lari]MCV3486149.1 flagellar hook-length control protein FliK [Campylobacter sp. CNRCH_2014_2452]
MITNISNNQNQFAKNETNKENKSEKSDKKTSLNEALKNPLFSKSDSEVKLPRDYVSKIDQKLQELLNKLLDQIKTNKDPDLAVLKNHKDLNFAPNFANEVKKLQAELSKNPEFEKLLKILEDLVKPAKDINNKNLSSLVKNSGIFLEAKLNHSLKEQNLPQSFFNLLSTIKGATSENLKHDISNLDLKNLDTTSTLKELIHILQNHKKDNKISLENTNYKTLFKLFDKIENFKNYINKNPSSISQEKLQNIADNFIKNLNKNLALINKELAKPENIKIQNTHILKELSQNIKDFIILLKDIKNHKNKTETTQENLNKTPHTKDIKEELKEEIKTPQKNTEDKKETQQKQESIVKDKEIQNIKEEKIPQSKDIKENPKEEPKTQQKNTEDLSKNDSKSQNLQTNNTKLEDIFKSTSGKILLEDIFKQNVSKNLNFSQNLQEELLNNLNKELGLIGRKLNEVLKALDPKNYEAKNSLDDIKNIEKKLELSIKDLGKITQKDSTEISSELQKDIKSTLLQVSNLAKNLDNESILNQANRLIAQLEFNQLLSLANNSIHTFLPFFWDDLEKSNVVFKRGKKDKFYAQINLEFEKLGKINVFLSLSNDKYIDINMMIENANFRKKLYERAHELKKALVKVGLLSSNFFISDIIKSKFHNQEEYNDFNMGFDTRA